VGKWTWAKDQQFAPPGTFFHQFVVPVIPEVRKDCTYGQLAGMVLPKDIIGLRTCEVLFYPVAKQLIISPSCSKYILPSGHAYSDKMKNSQFREFMYTHFFSSVV